MAELQRKKQKSVGTICKDAIMTGISYMIPVIVGGGVITAIAKMMGGYNIGDTAAEMQTLAQVIFTIGNNLFAFAVPCLAAFIAYAIADKPGIAPGYAMGVLAGLMKTGFVGGLVGALIAGWFVLQMKKIKVPKALQGIMPIMFIPVLSTLIVGLLMWYVIGVPIAWLMGIVVVMSKEKAEELGVTPKMKIEGYAIAGFDAELMGYSPKFSSEKLANKLGVDLKSIDMFEINEAFASQAYAVSRDLGLDPEKVNIYGGGISIGHPIGATGAMLTVKVMYELMRTDKKDAMISMCIGGGQGISMYFTKCE